MAQKFGSKLLLVLLLQCCKVITLKRVKFWEVKKIICHFVSCYYKFILQVYPGSDSLPLVQKTVID